MFSSEQLHGFLNTLIKDFKTMQHWYRTYHTLNGINKKNLKNSISNVGTNSCRLYVD